MVNFGLLAAEIDPVVWGTPANFNMVRVLAALLPALEYWALATLCSVEQRAPPIFGRAAITLGIGPHSSLHINQHNFGVELSNSRNSRGLYMSHGLPVERICTRISLHMRLGMHIGMICREWDVIVPEISLQFACNRGSLSIDRTRLTTKVSGMRRKSQFSQNWHRLDRKGNDFNVFVNFVGPAIGRNENRFSYCDDSVNKCRNTLTRLGKLADGMRGNASTKCIPTYVYFSALTPLADKERHPVVKKSASQIQPIRFRKTRPNSN